MEEKVLTISRRISAKDRLKSQALTFALRLMKTSWRLRVEGMDKFEKLYASETPFILCFWHGKYIPVLPIFQGYQACVLTSLSGRGNVIGEICRNFGYDYVQIPDRGGEVSLRIMEDALLKSKAAAIAVDGPLGPYHVVKKGVAMMASAMGYRLLPLSLEAQSKVVQEHRWDLMEIPKPFTRIVVAIGDPLEVPAGISPSEAAAWAGTLGDSISRLDRLAARKLREGPR
jgi:lysophospholipid acyltransferase (LPLAT)-like uncharacterized protein